MSEYRYFLKTAWLPDDMWVEVTKAEFVRAERDAGFRNTMGEPDEPATGGFHGHGVTGKVRPKRD